MGLAGNMVAETRVWPGQQVTVQKMSPPGGNNCKCQEKVKVWVAWPVTTSDHKQI